jgi:hypothetical protein
MGNAANIAVRTGAWLRAALLVLGFACTGGSSAGGAEVMASFAPSAEFVFARLRYDSEGTNGAAWYHYHGRIWERWETDFPESDENFARRLAQLSSVVPAVHGVARSLNDADVFDFPFLYVCDPGYMRMTAEERAALRRYLLAGGFLWVDDFWGEGEWWNFEREMAEVFPATGWRDIPADHPLLHSVFDLPGLPQIPQQEFAERGWKTEPGWKHRSPAKETTPAHLRGYFDADGRLMVVATHNTDIGDGFEREAYGQWYFETYSTQSYKVGVNIVIYALTH